MRERSVLPQHLGLTCSRRNLNDFTLEEKLLTWGNSNRLQLPATYDIGTLDTLPTELLDQVLVQLDLRTLADFRSVNRRATQVVDHLPQYKAIVTHAPKILAGILSIKAGEWTSCEELFRKLCTSACEQCGEFGGYLYLITCKRVCFLCFTEDKKYLPISPQQACHDYGFNNKTAESLPRMTVVPGNYTANEKKASRRILVDYESAFNTGITVHGSLDAMERYVAGIKAKHNNAYEKRLAAARETGTRVRRPPNTNLVDLKCANTWRYVAIVRAPWFDRRAQEIEWGFCCVGCQDEHDHPLHWRRQFTNESFQEHLDQCGDIHDRKHVLIDS